MLFHLIVSLFTLNIILIENCHACDCGLEKIQPRISGGHISAPHKYPWLAVFSTVINGKNHRCTGSLVSEDHILTAAHCVLNSDGTKVNAEQMKVYLGLNNLKGDGLLPLSVKEIIVDTEYDMQNVHRGHDIAALVLEYPVSFSASISPICVPSDQLERFYGQIMTIAGWGQVNGQNYATEPYEVNVNHIPSFPCLKMQLDYYKQFYDAKATRSRSKVVASNICAWSEGSNICHGDSGGPLMWKSPNNGLWYLIGIASRSMSCERHYRFPLIFGRVAYPNAVRSRIAKTLCFRSY